MLLVPQSLFLAPRSFVLSPASFFPLAFSARPKVNILVEEGKKGEYNEHSFFGPNGSGKGTQGAILQKQFNIQHIESGVIFRDNISRGTDLGKKAKGYIDRGELVPDAITIPMILERLKQPDCAKGWLLDGFPRNVNQAKQLDEALTKAGLKLDYVIEIVLDRNIAKDRIMGRRLCVNDNNHPNNIFIDAIKPAPQGGRRFVGSVGGN